MKLGLSAKMIRREVHVFPHRILTRCWWGTFKIQEELQNDHVEYSREQGREEK